MLEYDVRGAYGHFDSLDRPLRITRFDAVIELPPLQPAEPVSHCKRICSAKSFGSAETPR